MRLATLEFAAEDHIAVEIVSANSGPLEADEGGKSSGLIIFVGERSVGGPGIANRLVAFDRWHVTGKRPDDLHRGSEYAVVIPCL